MSFTIHEAANYFPMMSDDELANLAESISRDGLQVPIVFQVIEIKDDDGNVIERQEILIDGRNRLKACEMAGITPTYRFLDGEDPVSVIASLNTTRRNLNASQRALAAALAWRDAEAQGRTAKHGEIGGGHTRVQKVCTLIEKPREHFSNLFGANVVYTGQAKAVLDASPKIAEAVKAGATETWMKYPS